MAVLGLAALAVAITASLLAAAPARTQAGSPCSSRTVVPGGQSIMRADCEALWAFYNRLSDPGSLDDTGTSQWGASNSIYTWRGVIIGYSNEVPRVTVVVSSREVVSA